MSPYGYFSLDYKFMEGLAAANNYKILYSSYIITVGKTEHGSDLQLHRGADEESNHTQLLDG